MGAQPVKYLRATILDDFGRGCGPGREFHERFQVFIIIIILLSASGYRTLRIYMSKDRGESNCSEYTKQVCQRKRKGERNGALGVLDDR